MELPKEIQELVPWAERLVGSSITITKEAHGDASDVYQVASGNGNYFLKYKTDSKSGFSKEEQRLSWLKDKVPVPEVIGYKEYDGEYAILLSAVEGKNLKVMSQTWEVDIVIDKLVRALKHFHAINCEGWPFDTEDTSKVLVHGDACFPNFIFKGEEFSGYIDVGDTHLGTVEEDLAAAIWSLQYNLGAGHGPKLLESYGYPDTSPETVEKLRLTYEDWQRKHGFLD
ncbi:aminoglycoside 3'-phosphotransferase [soil metagenome]